MDTKINIQRIAIEIGEIVKWTRSVNEINRLGQAILRVPKENFPNTAITSSRQREIYNWLCSLGNSDMFSDERSKLVVEFCLSIANEEQRSAFIGVLEIGGIPPNILFKEQMAILDRENLHQEVYKHAKSSFQHEKYAHAVLEACKAYDKAVQAKTGLSKSGRGLMQEAWAWKGCILRVTTGVSESDDNYHEGLKLFSEGVMTGVRNIPAHEPILSWPIDKQDCIDYLHLLSLLFRKLEKSTNVKALQNAGAGI